MTESKDEIGILSDTLQKMSPDMVTAMKQHVLGKLMSRDFPAAKQRVSNQFPDERLAIVI